MKKTNKINFFGIATRRMIIPPVFLLLLALVAPTAHASLGMGLSVLYDKHDLGSGIGFAPRLNWQFHDNNAWSESVGIEIGYLNMDGSKTVPFPGGTSIHYNFDGAAIPFLFNYKLKWNPGDIFGFYTAIGGGMSFNSLEWVDFTGNKQTLSTSILAWQFQLGSSLTFADSYKINLGYRFLGSGDMMGGTIKGGHNMIDLGFHYQF